MDPVTLSESAADHGLALLLYGVLSDAAGRHGGGLPGLASRLGLVATDAGDEVTLDLANSRCVIEAGLVAPDLVIAASSALLPRLQALPTVLGLPLLASPAGVQLVLSLLHEPIRLHEPATLLHRPRRAARAALDLLRLIRLVAGG
mgnify:CR=1 FL=1|jgi:hypothetical protein